MKNPYRYRGYRYNTETGLYYLQSRCYNPEWGGFINADGIVGKTGELLSHNMFAYCSNNPVNREDSSGNSWIPSILKSAESMLMLFISVITLAVIVNSPLLLNPIGSRSNTRYTSNNKVAPISIPISKTQVHGNGKKSKRPQHGYEIYNVANGDVVKCGISGGKIRLDGKSYRAEKQVRRFNRDPLDGNVYASRIVEYLPNRASALLWEEAHSQLLWDAGNSMSKHKRPRPWEKD